MNTENIKDIIAVFEDSGLARMELEIDDMKIKMEKALTAPVVQTTTPPLPQPTAAPIKEEPFVKEEKQGTWIKAPIVGTFYHCAGPGSTPFITIGKHVKKGDVLCIIEAMKVMNELRSPVDGIVQEILVTNDSMVEFDQELIRIGEEHD